VQPAQSTFCIFDPLFLPIFKRFIPLSVQTNIGGEVGGSGGDYSMGAVLIECISGPYGCDALDIELAGEALDVSGRQAQSDTSVYYPVGIHSFRS